MDKNLLVDVNRIVTRIVVVKGISTLNPAAPVVNLIKHFTVVIYDSRVVLTTKLPMLLL